ncbi:hypothetical protein QBC37DRAFT_378737 [Rhypophila decipiens]|uniref:Uncharacterized protein n=1 Tax=Rhypophila decipiens TaxID=261697 RepID=A0AAN6Y051_9PEZI|nr:hypothetical protein QBC37DRAFT_378737 [Rhypophila decipiens]
MLRWAALGSTRRVWSALTLQIRNWEQPDDGQAVLTTHVRLLLKICGASSGLPLFALLTSSLRLPAVIPPEPAPAVAAAPEPAAPPPPPVLIPPIDKIGPGVKDAYFFGNGSWDSNHRSHIGTATRHIKFGSEMKLTDTHILTILAFGPRVCKKLLSFTVIHDDVSHTAHNDAWGVHDSSLVALARACPSLSKVAIQGVRNAGDACLLAVYQHCPRLNFIEIRGWGRGCAPTETAFTALRDNPDWMPKLRKLRLSFSEDNKPVMKAMREMGKLRATLVVTSVIADQCKSWGD